MIKNFSFLLSAKTWFEPMFFSGFFCGFERWRLRRIFGFSRGDFLAACGGEMRSD